MLTTELIWVFWLPCTIVHMIVFIIANKDDININLPTFYLGHVISWVIVSLATYFLIDSQSSLWIFYIVYVLLISTILSDIFLQQESFSLRPFISSARKSACFAS